MNATKCKWCGIENWQTSKPINENGFCGFCQDRENKTHLYKKEMAVREETKTWTKNDNRMHKSWCYR